MRNTGERERSRGVDTAMLHVLSSRSSHVISQLISQFGGSRRRGVRDKWARKRMYDVDGNEIGLGGAPV